MIYIVSNHDHELQHHGIIGQKWGRRRFQNPDGTLTELGKVYYRMHHGYGDGKTKRERNDSGEKFKSSRVYKNALKEAKKESKSDLKKLRSSQDTTLKAYLAAKKEARQKNEESAMLSTNIDRIKFFKDPNKARKDLEAELNRRIKLQKDFSTGRFCTDVKVTKFTAFMLGLDIPMSELPKKVDIHFTEYANAYWEDVAYTDLIKNSDLDLKKFDEAEKMYRELIS